MSAQQYEAMARKHWAKWLPKTVAALKASGELQQALQTAGKATQQQVLELMEQGFQQHEAEEVALPQFVLLKPESAANLEPWERKEMAELEREYRKMMGV